MKVYSLTYKELQTLSDYSERGKDAWRFSLVCGNGENGVLDNGAPFEGVMIFQNMKFAYPTNAIRVTPDMSGVRKDTMINIIEHEGKYLSQDGAQKASDLMTDAAGEWVKKMNFAPFWQIQNTYAFHPGHQLRLKMAEGENGNEEKYIRYTDYRSGEIGATWCDKDGNEWERKTFSSREDNVNITLIHSLNGAKINMTLTIDDVAKMSNEGGVDTELAQLRYRKIADSDYIGIVAHYPFYKNSQFNNVGFAGVTRVFAKGGKQEYIFGTEVASDIVNPIGGGKECEMNIGRDKAPIIKIIDADEVVLITKTEIDLDMCTLGEFEEIDGYKVVDTLLADTAKVFEKYKDYESALKPSKEKHREIFERLTYSVCVSEEDKAMRRLTNEELIALQKKSPDKLLPAMLERLFYNGRYAAICSSGIQAPRLGGMWTGAWGCEWSGDYTTDANINLQVAGANIGALPEETVGFINVMIKNVTDWQLNAKQVYGIDNALLAPTRTDGYTAVLTHFNTGFPGQMWLSGASWLILPMYEYYQCYGNQKIALTTDIRKKLEFTGNLYEGYTETTDKYGKKGEYHDFGIFTKDGKRVVYNLRNTLSLTDKRAEEILECGYFDLKEDILAPLIEKSMNFWLGFTDARFYTKDGQAYYDENHTALGDGEAYFIAPSYSPENKPLNTDKCYTANSVMDIYAIRSLCDMAKDILGENEEYKYLVKHLPPCLYEESGELKEWALYGYEENYGHRHGSQLYGLWPSYEGDTDEKLFSGAKKLIETKNSVDAGDSKTGHGWLHRGLVMTRLKSGEGVKDTLLPLVSKDMIYSSMMMAHNNDMTCAYCTDPVITIPAVLLESLVYSDENILELIPAMLPETISGGSIGGEEGIHTRFGGTVEKMQWGKDYVKASVTGCKNIKLKLPEWGCTLKVNGIDRTNACREGYYPIEEDMAEIEINFNKKSERTVKNFNREWEFSYTDSKEDWTPIAIPHSFSIPYDIEDKSFYIGCGWYRKTFFIPKEWDNKFISLDFDGVFQTADIYINGTHVPSSKVYGYENEQREHTHEGGYSGFSVDVTSFLNVGENLLEVRVDNVWKPDLTPRGGDHQFSGGIYRSVRLTAVNKTHIDWYGTFVWTPALCNPAFQKSENRPEGEYKSDFEREGTGIINTLDDENVEGEYVSEDEMHINILEKASDVEVMTEITNTSDKCVNICVNNTVLDEDGLPIAEFMSEEIRFAPSERKIIKVRSGKIQGIKLWSFDEPNLYSVVTKLYAGDKVIDEMGTKFGFRSAQFKLDGFYLNGEKILLDGANVHQDHGGWADAVTERGFYRDVKSVKEAGFNFIRGSHYPHAPSFAESCDELGIGFWSEGGLWSIGGSNDGDSVDYRPSDWTRSAYPKDEKYRARLEESCYEIVRDMIRVNRNHPSVIIWSMGNEAFFSDDSVTEDIKHLVNGLRNYAHKLDFTRKAGLGGTQRKDLNVLAVCDVAGGNGDGGTERYTNFYLPHMVAEYSSAQNDRPGVCEFQYGEIEDPSDKNKYILPSKTVTLADGSKVSSQSAGLSIWCMYHHGSVGGRGLRTMGLVDYYRLPTRRYYLYRKDRTGIEMPPDAIAGEAVGLCLSASDTVITNDGTKDVMLTVTMLGIDGKWVNDSRRVQIEVVSGSGVFPTGKRYVFEPNKNIWDGMAAIEFRSYYSGETVIQARITGTDIVSNKVTVTTLNVTGEEGKEPQGFMEMHRNENKTAVPGPESYGRIDVAKNRQSRADSSREGHIPINAIDGLNDTYWQAEHPGKGQSWWVFLENAYYLERVRVKTKERYDLFYKKDGDWVKLGNFDGSESEINMGGVYTDSIKLTFTDTKDNEYAKLDSLSAYGTTFRRYARECVCLAKLSDEVYRFNDNYSRLTAKLDGNENVKVYLLYEDDEVLAFENSGLEEAIDISLEGANGIRIENDMVNNVVLWGVLRDISCSDSLVQAARGGNVVYVRIVYGDGKVVLKEITAEKGAEIIVTDDDTAVIGKGIV